MFIHSVDVPIDYEIRKLKNDAETLFGNRYKDLNETGYDSKLTIYLVTKVMGDENRFETLISNHNPVAYRQSLQDAKTARRDRKQALRTKLNITKTEIRALVELIEDGNDD